MKQVVEVLRRSEQGVTRPFICRTEDDQEFWVKGRGAGTRALCCEWVAGRLAQALKLPIADFSLLWVPPELVEQSVMPEIADLGAGPVFGSLNVPGVREVCMRDVRYIPVGLRLLVLAFDWWITNADRTLGERGGNPNLLWAVGQEAALRMIDHNVAFDRGFRAEPFFHAHIFGEEREQRREAVLEARARLADIACGVRGIWHEMPEEWHFVDTLQSVPTDFSLEEVERTLGRLETCFEQDWMTQP